MNFCENRRFYELFTVRFTDNGSLIGLLESSDLLHQFPFLLGKRRVTPDSAAYEGMVPESLPLLTPLRQRVIRNPKLCRCLLYANLIGQLYRFFLKFLIIFAHSNTPSYC